MARVARGTEGLSSKRKSSSRLTAGKRASTSRRFSRRFRALAEEAVREQQTPLAYLAALLEAETGARSELELGGVGLDQRLERLDLGLGAHREPPISAS